MKIFVPSIDQEAPDQPYLLFEDDADVGHGLKFQKYQQLCNDSGLLMGLLSGRLLFIEAGGNWDLYKKADQIAKHKHSWDVGLKDFFGQDNPWFSVPMRTAMKISKHCSEAFLDEEDEGK